MPRWCAGLLVLLVASGCATPTAARFHAVVLGGSGGIDESDLTSVLLSRAGTGEYIALDAGTLVAGLRRAAAMQAITSASAVWKHHLHGVFLSHPHLDHVSGLVLASPEAPRLTLYGLAPTLEALHAHVFAGPLWANFTDEGAGALGRFHLARMQAGSAVEVPGAGLKVEALELSHAGGVSTAFLATTSDGAAVLSVGDTGPDEVEGGERLRTVWRRVAPLLRAGQLRAVFIEVSFPDPRPDAQLFGHLTPSWLGRELEVLASEAGGPEALRGLTVVVTHLKPGVDESQRVRDEVSKQLEPLRARGVTVVIPVAGRLLSF